MEILRHIAAACSARALAAFGIALTVGAGAAGCDSGRAQGPLAELAETFYQAMDDAEYEKAGALVAQTPALDQTIARYGSLASWGDRLTKNGIVAHIHPHDPEVAGNTATIGVLVMFHDGTRRRDTLYARRRTSEAPWRVRLGGMRGIPQSWDRPQ